MEMAATVICMCLLALSVTGRSDVLTKTDVAEELRALRKEYDARLLQCEEKIDQLTSTVKYIVDKKETENVHGQQREGNCGQATDTKSNTRQVNPQPSFSVKVAFYTQLTYDMFAITDNQTIVFDGVVTNMGSGYNSATGVFTAPVPGLYVFIWTTTNYNNFSFLQSEIMLNGVIKGRQWSDSGTSNDVSSATGSAVLDLASGDTVWIRTNSAHMGNALKGGTLSSFSGWLLN